ncbi:hypothetical protein QAO71_17895 (plasmid) [Halopseudomonas sp. SMJS2]|uniref:hypothetical protein n=1 Tax=Halopseudomonas sp. SMJS2 TaxID=3041098 RepID=UPI002452A2B6|nr:hypothetical protein [Halopseudomonas sp. SMJS2]WGK63415.1 hypothetical protein QAO71_17895 [Halopseudomonas sp. SMJS2]
MIPLDQLQLFKSSGPASYDVNSINGRKRHVPDTRPRLSAGAALKFRIVDDRVFSMGITTWKSLIDLAIDTGHTELVASDDERAGLRKPGFLYAPLPRLPDRAAEYVKTRLLAMGAAAYLSKRANPRKVSTVLTDGKNLVAVIKDDCLVIQITSMVEDTIRWELKHCAFPFTDGDDNEDLKKIRSSIAVRLKAHMKETGTLASLDKMQLRDISQALHELGRRLRACAL